MELLSLALIKQVSGGESVLIDGVTFECRSTYQTLQILVGTGLISAYTATDVTFAFCTDNDLDVLFPKIEEALA